MTHTLTHEQALAWFDDAPEPIRETVMHATRTDLARRARAFIAAGHDDRLQLASAAFVHAVATEQRNNGDS